MWGGFTGVGVKTIVPAKATAKVVCRLVPDQKPEAIIQVCFCCPTTEFIAGLLVAIAHVNVIATHGDMTRSRVCTF